MISNRAPVARRPSQARRQTVSGRPGARPGDAADGNRPGGRGEGTGKAGHLRVYLTAYLLWFFFGVFGAHRFYLKRTITANLYLATFGVFGLGWFVDSFRTFFLARARVRETELGESSFERVVASEFEDMETRDEGALLRSGRDAAMRPGTAQFVIGSVIDAILFVTAAAAILFALIYFDLVLLAFPLVFIWIVLLLNTGLINSIKDNVFILNDLPVNVENSLSATTYKVFQFGKGFKPSLFKYFFLPVYLPFYYLFAARRDGRRLETRELFVFFKLYTGLFLFWITIEVTRILNASPAFRIGFWDFLPLVHPLVLLSKLATVRGYAPIHLLTAYVVSAFLFLCLTWLINISNALILRNTYELAEERADRGIPLAVRAVIVSVIAVVFAFAVGAAFDSGTQYELENGSVRKFYSALEIAHQSEVLDSAVVRMLEGLDNPNGFPRNAFASATEVLLVRDEQESKLPASMNRSLRFQMEPFSSRLKGYLSGGAIDGRYDSFINVHTVTVELGGRRTNLLMFSVDNLSAGGYFYFFRIPLNIERRAYPLLFLRFVDSRQGSGSRPIVVAEEPVWRRSAFKDPRLGERPGPVTLPPGDAAILRAESARLRADMENPAFWRQVKENLATEFGVADLGGITLETRYFLSPQRPELFLGEVLR
ncbi:MAG: TM2 domain-containing protein [Spirochaetes bacterium]|nr:TM2 domain-containing protein [Spirochaetota bacterium]